MKVKKAALGLRRMVLRRATVQRPSRKTSDRSGHFLTAGRLR